MDMKLSMSIVIHCPSVESEWNVWVKFKIYNNKQPIMIRTSIVSLYHCNYCICGEKSCYRGYVGTI